MAWWWVAEDSNGKHHKNNTNGALRAPWGAAAGRAFVVSVVFSIGIFSHPPPSHIHQTFIYTELSPSLWMPFTGVVYIIGAPRNRKAPPQCRLGHLKLADGPW